MIMRVAFVLGGTSVVACGVALWKDVGLFAVGLFLVALGPLGAAFVDTDPITTPRAQMTGRSRVHAVLGSVFILGFPVAATCAGWGASLHGPGAAIMAWATVLPWAGLIWFLVASLRSGIDTDVGSPEVRIGWPNRGNMLAYLFWVAAADVLFLTRVL